MYAQLLAEALIVAIVFTLLFLVLPSQYQNATGVFVVGAVGHLLFEATGANAWYCKNGAACGGKK